LQGYARIEFEFHVNPL